MRRIWLYICILMALPASVFGIEHFPPPDFTSGYKLPTSSTPPPRAELFAYVDIAVLALALSVASYLVLKRRSRRGIVLLMLFSLAYFGFYRKGCICPVGSIQNVALSISDHSYALPLVVGVFFLLPLIFALFFGRTFCAGVCPLGAAQDVVLLRPVQVPSWLAHALGLIPWIYLGAGVLYAATGAAFLFCRYDPFISVFRLGGNATMVGIGVVMLLIGVFVGRPYCRFLCPYGAILKVISTLAKWRVTITPNECVNCRLCEDSCPFGAIRRPVPTESKGRRLEGKGRLAALIAILPVIVLVTGWIGMKSSHTLSQLHPTIRLAERVWLEDNGKVQGTTKESEAFHKHGRPASELYGEALALDKTFHTGGLLFGGWVGLVIGLKLVALSVRRKQTD
jgi:polyferredoxin